MFYRKLACGAAFSRKLLALSECSSLHIWFADPLAPWRRGRNQHFDGLLPELLTMVPTCRR